MSQSTRAGNETAGTDRVWKWIDQADNSRVVPESWAVNGERESADAGEQRFYAVEVRTGLRLQYSTDEHGQATGVANRERQGLRTLYVTADGGAAIVVESDAVDHGDAVTPQDDWPAVIARSPSEAADVAGEDREQYRALIRDLYGEVGR